MFVNIFKLITVVLYLYVLSPTRGSSVLRVFQGRDAVHGEFPYAVALAIKYDPGTQFEVFSTFCSGSIVTPIWTLTAGHCVEVIDFINIDLDSQNHTTKRPIVVIHYAIFSDNKQYEWTTSEVISTQLYPDYKVMIQNLGKFKMINDIGLVKTNRINFIPVLGKFSSVDYKTLYGHKVLATGFGFMNSDKGTHDAVFLNKSLQVYEAIVVKCIDTIDIIRPSFCVSWECNKPATSCIGDSGGPIVHPSGIVAVVTAGENENCDMVNTVLSGAIVTPVSPFLNWIHKYIKET